MLTCSVLIPSRARPERLEKAVRSILDTACDPSSVEVIIRIDDDDPDTTRAIERLRELGARVLVGARRMGYASLADFYTEMAEAASAPWIWIMNDDAWIEDDRATRIANWRWGSPTIRSWDSQLLLLGSSDTVMVQPEIYQLGGSAYPHTAGGPFPIVPNGCWKRYGLTRIENHCVDTWLHELLVRDNGWRTYFLEGIRVVHDRDSDAEIERHRRIP